MNTESDKLQEVLQILHSINHESKAITPTMPVLEEFDSLQILELVELLKQKYGVDFLATRAGLDGLRTAQEIARFVHDCAA